MNVCNFLEVPVMTHRIIFTRVAIAGATSLAFFAAQAQTTPAGSASADGSARTEATGSRNGSPTTPAGLPPGAKSTTGNMAAVPASGPVKTNPETASTPGKTPGMRSPQGNKAHTPNDSSSNSKPGASAATPR